MKGDIIDNYKRLPIGKYKEIQDIRRDKTLDDIDKRTRIISVLTDKDEYTILHLPMEETAGYASKIGFLYREPTMADANPLSKVYFVKGFELHPVRDHRKILTVQYVDFKEYAKHGDDYLVEMLSCFLVPKGKVYSEGYDILDVQNAMRESMSVSDVITLTAFFLTLYRRLIRDSLISSREEAMRLPELERRQMMLESIRRTEETFKRDGDGLPM